MGGKSSSRTQSQQATTDVTTSVGDNRVSEGGDIGGNLTTGTTGGNVTYQSVEVSEDATDLAEALGSQAINRSFDLAGSSLEANTVFSNEVLRRDQLLTAQIANLLDETRSGFGDVADSFAHGSEATGAALAGIAGDNAVVRQKFTKNALYAAVAVAALYVWKKA